MSQDEITFRVEPREISGKAVKRLRESGHVPAVIHDHGKPSIIVQGDALGFLKVYKAAGKHHPVNLELAGKHYTTMIKAVEFEPRKHRLNHIVFNAVSANQKVEAEVPIQPRYAEGNEASPAERAGLMVLGSIESIMVEALPSQLPDALFYNAEVLENVGDHVTIADLIVPEGVTIKADPNQGIASVFEPSAVAAANDAAGGAAEEEAPEASSEETAEGTEPAAETPAAAEAK